jgi:hypothetical protein
MAAAAAAATTANKKTLKFRNSSRVRNQLLNGSIAEYNVGTKAANGPSAVSNSLLRVNQKADPGQYQWNKSKSYANTFNVSKQNAASSKANYLNVRRTYKNGWVNATVAMNSYTEELEEMTNGYKSKLAVFINTMFDAPDEEEKEDIRKYIKELNEVTLDLSMNSMTKQEADQEMDNIYDKAKEGSGIEKAYFKRVYPTISAEYLALINFKKRARKTRNNILRNLRARA